MANSTNPMENLLFDNVQVINSKWNAEYYKCENVINGIATGNTFPIPTCFSQKMRVKD